MQISEFKQKLLWEKIIVTWLQRKIATNNHHSTLPLHYIQDNSWQLALHANAAWNTLQTWDIKLATTELPDLELKNLSTWITRYLEVCQQHQYKEVYFDELYCVWRIAQTNVINNNIKLSKSKIICADLIQELQLATTWAAQIFPGLKNKIIILLLDCTLAYDQIEYNVGNRLQLSQCQISFGQTLDHYQSIKLALLILKFTNNCLKAPQQIIYQDFSKILISPCLAGYDEEGISRAYVDYVLRKKVDYAFDLNYLKKNLLQHSKKKSGEDSIPIFLKIYNKFEKFIVTLYDYKNTTLQDQVDPEKKTCEEWVEIINSLLTIFGWSANNPSLIPELTRAWQQVLQNYLELTELLLAHTFDDSINIISKIIATSPQLDPQAANNPEKKVIVTNLSYAIKNNYCDYDYLWICGADTVNLKKQHKINSFLPKEVYQKINTKILSNSEQLYCNYINNLINSCEIAVIASYSAHVDVPTQPSNLIKDFQVITTKNLQPVNHLTQENPITLEKINNNYTEPYNSKSFSGTTWLKLQIACPFQANAKVRLGATSLKFPKTYLTKLEKGEIIHKVLADFWQHLRSNIKTLGSENIYQQLHSIAGKHLKILQQHKPHSFPTTLLHLEKISITAMCHKFIQEYELLRSEFAVLYLEEKFTVKLKDFCIKIKLDRVDKLQDQSLLIIDYKTGKMLNNYLAKADEITPEDPQLIIYSLIAPTVQGLILAHIKNSGAGLQGILANKQVLSELSNKNIKFNYPQNFSEYLNNASENLYHIATDFKQGKAIVKPKHGKQTCNHCDLGLFCRIQQDKR